MLATPGSKSRAAFLVIAAEFVLLTLGGTLPIPLYVLYAAEFGFAAGTTTLIFAIYVIGTLSALVFFGGLSDQVGRRPLLIAATVLTIASTAMFLFANGVPMLLAARLLSGFGVGIVMPVATAALAEVYPGTNPKLPAMVSTVANMGGLGLGPLVAGLFAEYGLWPTRLVFVWFLAMLVVVLVAVLTTVRESVPARRTGQIRWTPRFGVPRQARKVYRTAAMAAFPTFTLLGLFSSLTPAFLRTVLHYNSLVVAGAATFVLFELGVLAQLVARRRSPRTAIRTGLPLLVVSLVGVLIGVAYSVPLAFAVGPIVGGIATGLTFMGGLSALSASVPHDRHAGTVTTYFTAAQSGLAVPVVLIGALSGSLGTLTATIVVIVATATLALLAFLRALRWPVDPTPLPEGGVRTPEVKEHLLR